MARLVNGACAVKCWLASCMGAGLPKEVFFLGKKPLEGCLHASQPMLYILACLIRFALQQMQVQCIRAGTMDRHQEAWGQDQTPEHCSCGIV